MLWLPRATHTKVWHNVALLTVTTLVAIQYGHCVPYFCMRRPGNQIMENFIHSLSVQNLFRLWQTNLSLQEKVRRLPKGFVRKGNERMREREGGGGEGGSRVTRDELENELAGKSTLNQRHKCADLPSSWRFDVHENALTAQDTSYSVSRIHLSSARLEKSPPPPPSLSFPFLTKPFGERRIFSCIDTQQTIGQIYLYLRMRGFVAGRSFGRYGNSVRAKAVRVTCILFSFLISPFWRSPILVISCPPPLPPRNGFRTIWYSSDAGIHPGTVIRHTCNPRVCSDRKGDHCLHVWRHVQCSSSKMSTHACRWVYFSAIVRPHENWVSVDFLHLR